MATLQCNILFCAEVGFVSKVEREAVVAPFAIQKTGCRFTENRPLCFASVHAVKSFRLEVSRGPLNFKGPGEDCSFGSISAETTL